MNWKEYWNNNSRVRESDYCRQVGRTFRKAPYSTREMEVLVATLIRHLQAAPEKTLLDLACGNGLVTSKLAQHFKTVTAVDFSAPLIETARQHFQRDNINYLVGDIRDLNMLHERYDCVLASAAMQFLRPRDARTVLLQLRALTNARGGRIVLSDVADRDRIRDSTAV